MSNNKKEQKNYGLDAKLKARLHDTAWQKGLTWRKGIIEAVAEARRRGIPDREIFKHLKQTGLMDTTAKKIMNDAFYFEDSEISTVLKETSQKKWIKNDHPCLNCGKKIPLNLDFCSETCAKEYSSKKRGLT